MLLKSICYTFERKSVTLQPSIDYFYQNLDPGTFGLGVKEVLLPASPKFEDSGPQERPGQAPLGLKF
jgi:hypothetical protein